MKMKSRAVTRMSLAAIAASSALVLGACGGGGNTSANHQAPSAPSVGGNANGANIVSTCVDSGQVLNNPQSYAGKQVTMTGAVAQAVGPHAFTIATKDNNAQPLLAVDQDNMQLTAGSPVEVIGTLQPSFDPNQAAPYTGGSLGQGSFTSFNGKPYVRADFAGPISANLTRQSGGVLGIGNSCGSASDVLKDIQSYTGKQVTMTGKVAQVVGPHAVTIAPSGNSSNNAQPVLAVAKELAVSNETGMLTPGSPVQVTGTLQPAFDANQAEAFAGGNLDPTLFAQYNGKPFVQAVFAGPVSANLSGGQNGS